MPTETNILHDGRLDAEALTGKDMRCTYRTDRLIVVECLYHEPHHLLPEPLHTLDYQTDTLRFEFRNDIATLVALRLCGVKVPDAPDTSFKVGDK